MARRRITAAPRALAIALALVASAAGPGFAQWPPAAQSPPPPYPMGQRQGPGPLLLPTPGPPQGPSAAPADAPSPADAPTRVESETLIVEYDPAAWIKDSARISPDGKRLAVAVQAPDQRTARASVDGREQKAYGWVRDLTFSGDSRHVAYVATIEGKDLPVVDGREAAFRGEIWGGTRGGGGTLRLNRDGTRVAFVARQGNAPVFTMVVNGAAERATVDPNDGPPVFSPDGRRLAYVAQEGTQRSVVLDGRSGPKYDGIVRGTVTFSADSKRLAFVAAHAGRQTVVLDGIAGPSHHEVMPSTLRFSPDGTKLAYAAQLESGKWAVVVNGQAREEFDYIGNFTGITWSPDGKRLAYAALRGAEWGAVVDDVGIPYEAVAAIVFSPDSTRAAFLAQDGGRWKAVVHAAEGTYAARLRSDSVLNETLAFSPDGKHVLYGALAEGRPHMVVDGRPAPSRYEAIWNINGGRVVFESPSTFSYIAQKGDKIYLVREAIISTP